MQYVLPDGSMVRFSLWNFSSKKPQILHVQLTLPPFLNSTQQPACILAMLFCPRDFVELASGYIMYGCSWSYVQQYFEPNDPCSSKDSEKGIKCLEKCILLTLGHLQVFLLASNFESDILMSPKHLLAAEYTSKWQPPKSLLSRQISSG